MISVSELEVSRLFVGESNVRRDAGDITELTASIKEKGVLHPIVVRPVAKKFEVIVGSRRFAVAKKRQRVVENIADAIEIFRIVQIASVVDDGADLLRLLEPPQLAGDAA